MVKGKYVCGCSKHKSPNHLAIMEQLLKELVGGGITDAKHAKMRMNELITEVGAALGHQVPSEGKRSS